MPRHRRIVVWYLFAMYAAVGVLFVVTRCHWLFTPDSPRLSPHVTTSNVRL